MKSETDELRRWEDGLGDPGALAGRAADLVAASRPIAPLPPESLARIRSGALAGRAPRRAPLPLSLRFALLAAVIVASVATAKGGMILWRRHADARDAAVREADVQTRARAKPAHERAPVVEAVAVPEPSAALEPSAAPERVAPRPAHRRVALAAPAKEVRPPDDDAPATEGQLLARALARLRQAHDPKGALAVLDQYDRRYPKGVLAAEARDTRLEAAVALGDRRTALSILDGIEPAPGRIGAGQRLLRAELRASAGRYADALADFDRLLPPGAAPAADDVERALYDRAVCLGHLGADARARADLVDYQRRFPAGPHATEVARLLAGKKQAARP